ncbi:conjugal transfer protein TraF [Ideonella sp. 4Y11]|uniref:Conjugal transfer protein TraF n=1 Tax=Ideonella aquatica TaxID=2824119 RepID=A0A941BIA1_9BURK|nr:conjugal transfer protein TraF [Ideonella aquatica]MBQ0961751.1 conjugal transfer protein TraF [Ideonella aquatica]
MHLIITSTPPGRLGQAALRLALALMIGCLTSWSTLAIAAPQSSGRAVAGNADRGGYWQSHRDGWFWYQDPEMEPEKPPQAQPATPAALTADDRDLEEFKAFQQRLERSLNAAIINPNEANLGRFLELWAESRRKASTFTDLAQAVAMRMPWVDETAQGTRPPNPAAQRVFDQVQSQQNDDLMRSLSRTHGLYFFFRGDCAYCHAFSPMLKQFEQKYGFTVFAISMDGAGLPLFPRPARDSGQAARVMESLGIPAEQFQVPFTVLAQPGAREVLPVGFGPMTAGELVERIALLVRMRDEPGSNAATPVMNSLGGSRQRAASLVLRAGAQGYQPLRVQ